MFSNDIKIKYIGTATALLEVGGKRFLTDPAFDPGDTFYDTGVYVLHKLSDPAVRAEKIGHVDYVLLSHDHHFDNLDHLGRAFLSSVEKVFTTTAGAERLGGNSVGLQNWETVDVPAADGKIISITGTPCRHGPAGSDRGPVTGFVLNYKGEAKGGIYITGDTVMYEGVEEVSKRFDVDIVVAFVGAAKVKQVGDAHLTMTAQEAVVLTKLFSHAKIIPLHFEGWEHFTESSSEILKEFKSAGLGNRLQWADKIS